MDLLYNTFDAGLLGRELDGRTDLAQYYRGSRRQENFISKPSGGARLRPGFEYVGGAPTVTIEGTEEVAATYGLSYYSENSTVWGVPIYDGTILTLDAGAAVDRGGGIVGVPCTGHPFAVGQTIFLAGTSNYDDAHVLTGGTTANELQFADTYNAETFAGTETVVRRTYPLTPSTGRMAVDSNKNIYYGSNWIDAQSTYITKIAEDGTITYDAVTFSTLPGVPGYYTVTGVLLSSDESYLYVANQYGVYKFDLSDGSEAWVSAVASGYDMALDADDNAYAIGFNVLAGIAVVSKYDADTGSATAMTKMGHKAASYVGGSLLTVRVDDTLGVVIGGGNQYCLVPNDESVLYNLCVRRLDDSGGAQVAVGGTYINGTLNYTHTIGVGQIATNGEHIFVCIAPTSETTVIYKFAWDGNSLSEVTHVAGPPHALKIYFDLYGNLVAVNNDGSNDDIFWFYDSDLNYLSKAENFSFLMLTTWKAGGGTFYQGGMVDFDGTLGTSATEESETTGADEGYPTRLIGFVKGTSRYVLEFSHEKMRVYKGGTAAADALVMVGGSAYSIATPWQGDELFDLVFVPQGQAIFHPDYEPRRLTCAGDASWTLSEADFEYGPFLKENTDTDKTITPSDTTGSITLTATGHTPFNSNHVGSLWRLTHRSEQDQISGYFSAVGTSDEIACKGRWKFYLENNYFDGTILVERSLDDGDTWETVHRLDDNGGIPSFYTYEGEELEDGVLYRINCVTHNAGNPRYVFTVFAADVRGIVQITAFTSTTVVTGTVLNTLGNTYATYKWAEGAWSDYQGYPKCGTIHESRIFAANTVKKPNTIWAGASFKRIGEDPRIMLDGVEDDDAFWRTIDLVGCDDIRFLASMWVLLIGADGAVDKGIGASEFTAMTPRNSNFLTQSGMGCGVTQPELVAGFLCYASRNRRRAYELTYSNDTHVYQPEDLTFFNPTILSTGVKEWAFQQQPYPILWAVLDDGNIAALTRDRDKGLVAWYQITTDGTFESVAIIPGEAEDEVWVIANRDIEGTATRLVERLKPFYWGSSQRDCFFVDSGTTWDGGAAVTITDISLSGTTVVVTATGHGFFDDDTVRFADVAGMTDVNEHVYTVADRTSTTFTLKTRDGSGYIDGSAFSAYTSGGTVEQVANSVTGLTQLASESVVVLLDGQPSTGTVSTAGVYTIGTDKDRYYKNTIHVGREMTGILSPMWPEVNLRSGTTAASKKKILNAWLRLYQSAGGALGSDADDIRNIDYTDRGDTPTSEVSLVSEDREINHPGGWDRQASIYIKTTKPLPFTVSALIFEMEV